MKTTWTAIVIICLLPITLKAQVAPDVLHKYPAAVIYRLYSITSKINLPAEKQNLLAQYFLKQDKDANLALAKGSRVTEIINYYTIDHAYLKTILSPVELNDYKFATDDTPTQLVAAVRYREKLGLNSTQINDLLNAANNTETIPNTVTAEVLTPAKQEGEQLTKILNDKQYDSFLELFVKPAAIMQNNDAWAQLKKYNLVQVTDAAKIRDQNLNFFIKADVSDAKVYNSKKYIKLDSVRGEYFTFKPSSLLKLDMINNTLPESQFADVLKNKRTLAVTGSQTDSLIRCISGLEKEKSAFKKKNAYKKYDPAPFEAKGLLKILNETQYGMYLGIKNKDRAITNEKKTWDRLKQYGLTQNIDSVRVSKELINYELAKLVTADRFHNDDSPQNSDIKTKAEANKPLILKKLDVSIKTTALTTDPKKTLAW